MNVRSVASRYLAVVVLLAPVAISYYRVFMHRQVLGVGGTLRPYSTERVGMLRCFVTTVDAEVAVVCPDSKIFARARGVHDEHAQRAAAQVLLDMTWVPLRAEAHEGQYNFFTRAHYFACNLPKLRPRRIHESDAAVGVEVLGARVEAYLFKLDVPNSQFRLDPQATGRVGEELTK